MINEFYQLVRKLRWVAKPPNENKWHHTFSSTKDIWIPLDKQHKAMQRSERVSMLNRSIKLCQGESFHLEACLRFTSFWLLIFCNERGHSGAPVIYSSFKPCTQTSSIFFHFWHRTTILCTWTEVLAFDEWQAVVVLCMLSLLAVVLEPLPFEKKETFFALLWWI